MKNSYFFRIITSLLVFILILSLMAPAAFALEQPEISCKSALVINAENGNVYYSKDADEKVYPASLTKIMTLLLAVEAIEDGSVLIYDEVTALSDLSYDLIEGGSNAGIKVGETMTLESLLYCAALSSANEACNVIAEYIAGSISGFIDRMNSRAIELGCRSTHFANTHGLPNDNHYTTPNDYAKIVLEAQSHELFRKITSTSNYQVPDTNSSPARNLHSSNALINPDGMYGPNYIYEYATGIKTGFTSAAGYCLAAAAQKDDISLITLVFGGDTWMNSDSQQEYDNFIDTITLFNWVFDNFSYNEIVDKNVLVTKVPVSLGGDADSVSLVPASSITVLTPNDYKPSDYYQNIIIYSEAEGKKLEAPISSGDVLGEMSITKDGINYGTVKLVAASSIELSHGQYILSKIKTTLEQRTVKICITVLVLLLVLYLALVISYRIRRIKHKKAAAAKKKAREQRQVVSQDEYAYYRAPSEKDNNTSGIIPDMPDELDVMKLVSEEASEEYKEERDYFEEFFKQK